MSDDTARDTVPVELLELELVGDEADPAQLVGEVGPWRCSSAGRGLVR